MFPLNQLIISFISFELLSIPKIQQKSTSERHNVFTEEINKIALKSNLNNFFSKKNMSISFKSLLCF